MKTFEIFTENFSKVELMKPSKTDIKFILFGVFIVIAKLLTL